MNSERLATRYDPEQHELADRIEQDKEHWHVAWGAGSRRFYAYPRFNAPPGTIVIAASPESLIAGMRHVEHEFEARHAGMRSRPSR